MIMIGKRVARRRASTLVELLIGGALLVGLIGILVSALVLSRRGEKRAERQACLEAAVLAQELVESDLRRLVVKPGAEPIHVDASGRAIGLWAFAHGRAGAGSMPALPVT